jgi:peptidoglycan/LPS O-acetylase OafA/YrhL
MAIVLVFAASRGFIGKSLLSHPVMIRLGELSFGIYLFHQPLLSWLNIQRNSSGFQSIVFEAIPEWCYFPVVLAVTLILSWVSHDWFETPARRLLKGR